MDFNEAKLMLRPCQSQLNCGPFPKWFQMDFDQTKLILTKVLTIKNLINFN